MPVELGDVELYTVLELSKKLDLSERTVRKLIREGTLKGRKLGKKWYVSDKFLKEYFLDVEAQYNSDGNNK